MVFWDMKDINRKIKSFWLGSTILAFSSIVRKG